MNKRLYLQRSDERISPVLAQLKSLWQFYPDYSLAQLLHDIVLWTNLAESRLPITDFADIEDVAYPKGHLFHGIRHLGMGIAALASHHEGRSPRQVPYQLAVLAEMEKKWRRNSQMRLTQLLAFSGVLADLQKSA